MTTITAWAGLTLVLCFMASLAIWSRRESVFRLVSVLALLPCIVLAGGAVFAATGLPLPYVAGITIDRGDHTVLGFKVVEDVAIYVLMDGAPPKYYVLPYSDKTAQALQDARRKAGKGGKVKAGVKGDGGIGGEMSIWPAPQPPLPEKYVQAN